MKKGIELIAKERREQIEKHNRTVEHDVEINCYHELVMAAGILTAAPDVIKHLKPEEVCPPGWNIEIFTKMFMKPYKERLVIAGALIAAEIDRINYKSN